MKETILNVLSLFDGISCGQVALDRAGIQVETYYASEIDKHAICVTQKNYPNTVQLGDVTKIDGKRFFGVDLLIGGSPCQGFSFAGKGLNFTDPRSALFFEYIRILRESKPRFFLLENVRMKKECEDVITKYLGVSPIEINSALVSAQNRRRLYWTNIPDVIQPEDKRITWGHVREHGVEWSPIYYSSDAMDWIGRHGVSHCKRLKVHGDHEKMQMVEASHYKKYSSQRFFGIVDEPPVDKHIKTHSYPSVFENLDSGKYYRYITPLECERLQTLPDHYTNSISNTQRYKAIGNGWTVDVIAHILSHI